MHSGPEQLRDWMRRRGFTQADAARYLECGQDYMSVLLAGKRSPGLDNAVKIERLTGIPVEAWVSNEVDDTAQTRTPDAQKRTA